MYEKSFFELQKKIFSLFQQNNLDDALNLIDQAQHHFPNRMDKTSFWKACAYALLDRKSDAIHELNVALDQGVWWNPQSLIGDPDLQTLQEDETFQAIVAKCKHFLESERYSGKAELEVFGNMAADVAFFILHWRGSNIEDFAPFWLEATSMQKYCFGFSQSSQLYGYNTFCWDNSEVVHADIQKMMDQFIAQFLNKKDIIIGGASQGAKVALELMLDGSIKETLGFIFVVPAIKDVAVFEKLIENYAGDHLRGVIITGDQDPFYPYVLDLMPILEKGQIQCKLVVKDGMGHFFPNDFIGLLHDAVSFIREGETL